MQDLPWWHPKALVSAELKTRAISDVDALDVQNDFGSYRAAALGADLRRALVHAHNDLHPAGRVQWLVKLLGISDARSVLDAGCGLGFTTAAIARELPKSSVLGVDVSSDAVTYARQRFPNAKFAAQAISPDGPDLGRFDVIFCFEFYPFTRNSDAEAQALFVRYLVRQLNEDGLIVIYQKWPKQLSLSDVFDRVRALCPGLRMELHAVPHPKIPRWVPTRVAITASHLLRRRRYAVTVTLEQRHKSEMLSVAEIVA